MKTEPIATAFLTACALDYEMLSGLIDEAGEATGVDDPGALRHIVSATLHSLLEEGLLEPGFPEGFEPPLEFRPILPERVSAAIDEMALHATDNLAFVAWAGTSRDWIERIAREWDALGRSPHWGDICWFRITERGRRWLERIEQEQAAARDSV